MSNTVSTNLLPYQFYNSVMYNDSDYINDKDEFGYEKFSLFNVISDVVQESSTKEIIDKEQDINSRIDDIKKVQSYYASSPSIFASFSESFVLSIYENVLNAFKVLSLDTFHTDISQEDEYLFVFGKKRDIILFFNLFFENNDVNAMVVVSTPKRKYIIEDDVENGIQKLFQIFQEYV